MSTSLREIFRHIEPYPPAPSTLRQILKRPNGGLRLRVHEQFAPFSIMCHNMGLLVFPASYLGTDREGAIDEIVLQIQRLSPDVVGLCEVFANDERKDIYNRLGGSYPYMQEGPDEADLESDGGLLLLSRYPFIQSHTIIYEYDVGGDSWANKGAIHIRIQPSSCPMPYDVFFTHTQNIKEDGGREALYKQLTAMDHMIQQFANPNSPTLIMGDINIPAQSPQDYNQMLNRLRMPVDLWVVNGNDERSLNGCTFVADNNFYEDNEDNPKLNERLDYVLMKSGSKFIPILKNIEILKITRQGRFISDHFGLLVRMEKLVQVDF